MPGNYWSGLVEGFQGRREAEYTKNAEREVQNRAMADRVFSHLLQSRDPEMQRLALSGLMSPTGKKQGLAGFLGQVTDVNPLIDQIVSRSNEMIPDEGSATPSAPTTPTTPTPPAAPGSAAMSTNAPVEPQSAPIAQVPMPPEAPPTAGGMGPPDMAQLGPMGQGGLGVGMPPPPPPEHPMHRRGTGVPTAEEIAGATAQAQLEGRVKAGTSALQAAGATPEEIQQAIMGMLGAPQNQRNFQAPAWAVIEPDSGNPVPVAFDTTTGNFTFTDGSPVPKGAKFVRMSGGASGGGVPRTGREPDPNSSTGWSKVFYDTATGQELYRVDDVPFVPPPAYAGTTVLPDLSQPGVNQVVPVKREGGTGPALGDQPSAVKSDTQIQAESLKAAVDAEIDLFLRSTINRAAGMPPAQRDQVVQRKAVALGLPYKTYDAILAAIGTARPVTQREAVTGGTVAERVRARALQNRQGGAGGAGGPVKPSMPPTAPIPNPPATAGPRRRPSQ